jgi:hypothetical protein
MTDGSLGGNVRREPRESVRPPGRAVSCLGSEQAENRARVAASKVVRVELAVAGMALEEFLFPKEDPQERAIGSPRPTSAIGAFSRSPRSRA